MRKTERMERSKKHAHTHNHKSAVAAICIRALRGMCDVRAVK